MLNFFRKKRKKLADDNKLLKYLRYAIGEIVLVAIGILLALQVNNWNERRLKHVQEILLLKRLSVDLIRDTINYNERFIKAKSAIDRNTKYIKLSYKNQKNLEEAQHLFRIIDWETGHLTTSNSTYREMISTGSINHIQDDFLKKMIIDYYRVNEEIGIDIEEFNAVSTDSFTEMISTVPNIFKVLNFYEQFDDPKMYIDTDWEFINDSESNKFMALESTVNLYLLRNIEHLPYFQKLLSHSKALNIQVNEAILMYE